MDIERFSLKNSGVFVACLHVAVRPVTGGRVREFRDERDIRITEVRRINLETLKIPDGSHVRLKAWVVAGVDGDPVSDMAFVYRKGCGHEAQFVISGTTGNHPLRFKGMAFKPPG